MRIAWLMLVMLGVGIPVQAQMMPGMSAQADPDTAQDQPTTQPPSAPRSLASPAATMQTFIEAAYTLSETFFPQPEDRQRLLSTMNFAQVEGDIDQRELADMLYQILNRIELVDIRKLPNQQEVRAKELEQYVYFPQARLDHNDVIGRLGADPVVPIILSKQSDGRWLFDAQTVAYLPELYAQFKDLPKVVDQASTLQGIWLESQLPSWMQGETFLGLKSWQWMGLLFLSLFTVVLDYTSRLLFRVIVLMLMRNNQAPDKSELVKTTVRPMGLLLAAIVWIIATPFLGLPHTAELILISAARVVAIGAGTWAAWRITDLGSEVLLAKASKTSTRFDDVLVPLLRKALKVFILVIGIIYGANTLQINIWPLVASLGLGSVALAFAAKDTIENFFGSIAVLLDRPFDVGDWVNIDNTEGIIESVGFRSTRIRTFYNSQITVPNANLVRASVDNYGRRRYRRYSTHVAVQYDTTPDQLVAFAEGIRELIRTHPYTRKDYYQVWLNGFGASSLDILLYVFFEVPDWSTELRERERLMLDIIRLADQLGVQFAFPTQTLHVFQEDASAEHQSSEMPSSMTERRSTVKGIRLAQQLIAKQPWTQEKPGPVELPQTPTHLQDDPAEATQDRAAFAEHHDEPDTTHQPEATPDPDAPENDPTRPGGGSRT